MTETLLSLIGLWHIAWGKHQTRGRFYRCHSSRLSDTLASAAECQVPFLKRDPNGTSAAAVHAGGHVSTGDRTGGWNLGVLGSWSGLPSSLRGHSQFWLPPEEISLCIPACRHWELLRFTDLSNLCGLLQPSCRLLLRMLPGRQTNQVKRARMPTDTVIHFVTSQSCHIPCPSPYLRSFILSGPKPRFLAKQMLLSSEVCWNYSSTLQTYGWCSMFSLIIWAESKWWWMIFEENSYELMCMIKVLVSQKITLKQEAGCAEVTRLRCHAEFQFEPALPLALKFHVSQIRPSLCTVNICFELFRYILTSAFW